MNGLLAPFAVGLEGDFVPFKFSVDDRDRLAQSLVDAGQLAVLVAEFQHAASRLSLQCSNPSPGSAWVAFFGGRSHRRGPSCQHAERHQARPIITNSHERSPEAFFHKVLRTKERNVHSAFRSNTGTTRPMCRSFGQTDAALNRE